MVMRAGKAFTIEGTLPRRGKTDEDDTFGHNHLTMSPDIFTQWLGALEARHLADLRTPEVARALRALSAAYVERRHTISRGATLDTAGKRAAFAMFYGPLHFLATQHVVRKLDATAPTPTAILDLGCGTGVAGAAWALAAGGRPIVRGIDRHPWAVAETRWTYRQLGVRGTVARADVSRLPRVRPSDAVVCAYVLNELADSDRQRLEKRLLMHAERGTRVLVLEPIARSVTPWWDTTRRGVEAAGGRGDEWRIAVELPPILELLDRAAGLKHHELTLRSLYCPGNCKDRRAQLEKSPRI
jgi:protein-L-isoaspartate O-methyltransferase